MLKRPHTLCDSATHRWPAAAAFLLALAGSAAMALADPAPAPEPAPPKRAQPAEPAPTPSPGEAPAPRPEQPSPDAPAPSGQPAPSVPAPSDAGSLIEVRPAIDTLTSELLDEIESSGQSITTMQAAVIYDRRFLLQGDQHIRTGNLYFESLVGPGGVPLRRFAIAFDRLFVDQVMRNESQRFVFDGRWLVERDDAAKQYIAREVAPPGAAFDPLRLGEGPMPIPLGQRKADILSRYDARATWGGAEWVDADEAALGYRSAVESARQLILTPRPQHAESDQFQEIRLWYAEREGILLPVLSRTVSKGGDTAFVRLLAFRINDERPASVQRLREALRMEPPAEPGWEIQRIDGRWDEQDVRRVPVTGDAPSRS
jgi:hypothetical protein